MIPIQHICIALIRGVNLFIFSRDLHVDRHINIIQYEINALYAHMYALGTKSRLNV